MINIQDTSEEALLIALKKNDNDALKHIYKLYWPMISQFILRNNGTRDDAEELYQEGIIALYEKTKASDFTLTCSLKTFIYSICRNKWLHKLRSRKPLLDIEHHIEILPDESDQEDVTSDFPNDKQIMQAIASLGDPCHSLLVGFYYHKLSLEELGQRLNYANMGVAKQQKFRCIERLKKIFQSVNYKYAND